MTLSFSRALWNRRHLVLESDEILAQVLDRGTMNDWRALYGLARTDPALRARLVRIINTVPLSLPRFWLAALADLGEAVQLDAPLPDYYEHSSV